MTTAKGEQSAMLQFLRSLFSPSSSGPVAHIPQGQRVYAVGDIHGRLDLFEALAGAIEADDARGTADTTVILLGDLVDRGPASAGVLALAREWQARRKVRILYGNHEELLVKSLTSLETMRHFLRHGGRETMQSFGISAKVLASAPVDELQELWTATVPADVLDFISGFEEMIRIGDYLFVHAGINPATPLASQKVSDLRWIREPFLSHPDPFEAVVVHGHSITDQPQDKGNRIGIDTGAYSSGRLTALVLEGATRRYIEAVEADGEIGISHRAPA